MNDPLLHLPDDVAEGYEQMKLAIMRHRADCWNEISEDQMILVLYYLQRMAMGFV
jgi:hypothetical protein